MLFLYISCRCCHLLPVRIPPQAAHTFDTEYIYLDAHILSTPAIADIDADGNDELVIAVSYFYDAEYYDDPLHAQELKGIDKDKYVAGKVVSSYHMPCCKVTSLVGNNGVVYMCVCVCASLRDRVVNLCEPCTSLLWL